MSNPQQQRSTTSFWGTGTTGSDTAKFGADPFPPPPAFAATSMHSPPPAAPATAGGSQAPPPPPPPPCPVKSLTQFGSLAKDVLVGSKAEGLFGVPGTAKLSISSATTSGVSITTTATSSTGAASKPPSGQLLGAYASPDGAWLGDVLLTSGGVAELTVSRSYTLPASLYTPSSSPTSPRDNNSNRDRDGSGGGAAAALKPGRVVVGGVLSLPGLSSRDQVLPPKLTLDYAGTYWHAKTSTTLPLAPGGGLGRPSLTASAVTGAGRLALGADVSLTTTSATTTASGGGGGGGATGGAAGGGGAGGGGVRVTRWSAAAAWHDERQHVAMQLLQGGKTASLLYGYCLQPGVTLGVSAEADVAGVSAARRANATVTATPGSAATAAAGAADVAAAGGAQRPRALMPPPTFAVGASFRLPAARSNGNNSDRNKNSSSSSSGGSSSGVVKVKAASDGTLSVLYRDVTSTGQRLTLTAQLDALDLTKSPRLGLAVDV
ncbi:hypothetical protein HYH02_011074 [Chlamydomonas schloesseri]|uniref:Uncharacterized protein n=1 Tax=Chlamydomonas schloesseri TaxID=2026947 RepID=A0A835W6S7_9CHLO|nr:hypothetical protein HYH02_011074 [Chlamydomonas schloesseri]|eukprot:KAG2437696.1 hypothetical protein HYH02_011074 [Chlamydomonas schloesseri]